jgi:Effector-associated domain 11
MSISNTQKFIAHIRALIAKDDFKTAIQQLSALLKDSPCLDEAVLQSARYNNVMQQIRLGLVDFASANTAQNQIRNGVLELLREIEEQAQVKPNIKTEVEHYAVKYEKNVVKNSTITAGGNVTIGDTIHQTESDTSRRIRLFLLVFVPILAIALGIGYYQYQRLKEPLTLTVLVTDATPNPNIPFEEAKVTLTYGGKPETQIVEKEATFKEIPPRFRDNRVDIKCEADGFVSVQSIFMLSGNTLTIPLSRDNSLATIFGHVKDEKGYGLADVELTVQDITVLSSASGFYSLPIPPVKQWEKQRLRAFKQGFKNWDFETPVLSGTPVDIILKK